MFGTASDAPKSSLQKTSGLSPENAFNSLCLRKFDTSEDMDNFGSDVVHLISVAFPKWDKPKRDELARSSWVNLAWRANRKVQAILGSQETR